MFIDTHCHLNISHFKEDLEETVSRALEAGVDRMIVIGCDLASSELAVELSNAFDALYAVVGYHPNDAAGWQNSDLDEIRRLASNTRVVAIGEIGLDYHHHDTPVDTQETAFRSQLSLAKTLDMPIVIHCREAYEDTLRILEEEGMRAMQGVMHCWAGSTIEAEQALSLGMYLGFGGTVTYKKAENILDAVLITPLDRILLETDAPFLSPVPYRGKRNESAYIPVIAETIAQIKNLSVAEIAEITTSNAEQLFTRLQSF